MRARRRRWVAIAVGLAILVIAIWIIGSAVETLRRGDTVDVVRIEP